MRDDTVAEKCRHAAARAVVKLIGNQKFERPQFLLQRAYRAHGNHALDAEKLHRVQVRAVVDLRGHESMAASVARKECHAAAFDVAHHERVGRIAEGGFHANFSRRFEAWHGVKTAAANNSDLGLNFPQRFRCCAGCRPRLGRTCVYSFRHRSGHPFN